MHCQFQCHWPKTNRPSHPPQCGLTTSFVARILVIEDGAGRGLTYDTIDMYDTGHMTCFTYHSFGPFHWTYFTGYLLPFRVMSDVSYLSWIDFTVMLTF